MKSSLVNILLTEGMLVESVTETGNFPVDSSRIKEVLLKMYPDTPKVVSWSCPGNTRNLSGITGTWTHYMGDYEHPDHYVEDDKFSEKGRARFDKWCEESAQKIADNLNFTIEHAYEKTGKPSWLCQVSDRYKDHLEFEVGGFLWNLEGKKSEPEPFDPYKRYPGQRTYWGSPYWGD